MRSFFLFLSLSIPFGLKADALRLTVDGKPNAEILLPENAQEEEVSTAQELQTAIAEISGATLPITSVAADGVVSIYLGRTLAEEAFADDLRHLERSDGYAVRRNGPNLYIFGTTPEGTRNGVFAFLERNTDIIWARPADFGTIFTKTPTIEAREVDFREKPAFLWRGWNITSVGGKEKKTTHEWAIRNRCNWTDYGPRKSFGGGHNLYRVLGEHVVDGGAFVGMTHGERKVKGAPQPCFSNRDMWRAFTDKFLEIVKTHPEQERFEININDTNRTCECPGCAKALLLPDGSTLKPSDPAFRSTQFYQFLNHVAGEVGKRYPNVKINSYAYVFSIVPPKIKLADNISIEFAPLDRDYKGALLDKVNEKWGGYLQQWMELCDDMIIYEYYGWSEFPRPISCMVARDLRHLSAHGVKRIHSELNPDLDITPWNSKTYVLSEVWDASAMEYWVISKLFWNPDQDVDLLRREFLARAYREAAPAMTKYYDLIRDSWYSDQGKSNYRGYGASLMARYVVEKGVENACRAALREAEEKSVHPGSREMVKRARRLFEKTLRKAKEALPPEVEAPYVAGAAACGLNFNSPPWEKASLISNFKLMGTKESTAADTTVRLMRDSENLYLGFDCPQSAPKAPPPEKDQKDEPWTWGDHIEIFIGDGAESYYQLNVDCHGRRFDAHGFDKKWKGDWRVATKITPQGWKALAVIPFSTLRIDPKSDSELKALFCRQCHQTGTGVDSSWRGGRAHQPAEFGVINLNLDSKNGDLHE